MAKTFCPLMLIGFDPPKGKEKDMRVCHPDCAWYNEIDEECFIQTIGEETKAVRTYIENPIEEPWETNY